MSGVNLKSGKTVRRERSEAQTNTETHLTDKVVFINRCAKVVKGGRRFSFSALVVVGDGAGKIGIGLGKAKETPDAVKKAVERAKKDLHSYAIVGHTIPHEVVGSFDGGLVILRPAAPGTGIVAGGGVRLVLEALGVSDVLSKSMGSNNPFAMVRATLNALSKLRSYGEMMSMRHSATDEE